MKLFYSPGTCSLAQHILLNELSLAHEIVPVNLKTKHYQGGDFTAVNPKGSVPALQIDNGQVLTEGAVILQYLADQKPEKAMMPPAGWERYRAQEWLNFIATELHKGFGPLWNPAASQDAKQGAREKIEKRLDYLAPTLSRQPFLMGASFTACDAYLFTILRWCKPSELSLSRWPALGQYLERVQARPAVALTLQKEGLS